MGTLRSNTAAMAVGNLQTPGGQSYKKDHGYSAYQASLSKQKQLVFSWGCNLNHQLGLFQLQQDQVEIVREPTLIEELLQYISIRKIKC